VVWLQSRGSVSGFHTLFDNVIRLGGRVGLWPVSSRCFEFLLTKPGVNTQNHSVMSVIGIRSESVEREVQRQEFGSLYAAASNG